MNGVGNWEVAEEKSYHFRNESLMGELLRTMCFLTILLLFSAPIGFCFSKGNNCIHVEFSFYAEFLILVLGFTTLS